MIADARITDVDAERSERLVRDLLSRPESETLETKRVSGKMVGKALETVCAFANTRGGVLALGIEDPKKASRRDRLYGVSENTEAVDELIRKLRTQLSPAVSGIRVYRLPCTLRDNSSGELVLVDVPASDSVHSVKDGGTWTRGLASNRNMDATEITELSYQRGIRSAESDLVDIEMPLLNTEAWRAFVQGRGLGSAPIEEQMVRCGLASRVDGVVKPMRAAVLLFADDPGSLLAPMGTRADIRVFHYHGNVIESGEVPNLRKAPKTISGPLYLQISITYEYVLNELAAGLTMAASGFSTVHKYPTRVLKEAITNAVIHRDYRLNRDTRINIFDNRIIVLSAGFLPGKVSVANIEHAGSFARNPIIAKNLREFPQPPNVDAGEGVPMMFNLMRAGNLYPPIYTELREQTQPALAVLLLNEMRPPIWEQVSDWMDRNGPIANADLRAIAGVDTLKASRLLKGWVGQGVLVADATRNKKDMVYRKPEQVDGLIAANTPLSKPPEY